MDCRTPRPRRGACQLYSTPAQRDLRDLTRQRTSRIRERATVANRLQKVLEWAHLTLASVATDVLGTSARAMLDAIVDGQRDVAALAELANGRMLSTRAALEQALAGRVRDHHRFMIARHLEHVDFLDEQIVAFDAQITALIEPSVATVIAVAADDGMGNQVPQQPHPVAAPTDTEAVPMTWAEAVAMWDDVPGIGRRVAEQLVAEIGTDLRQFHSAAHLASWATLCPGNHESAGKRTTVSIGTGNSWLRSTLVQAAHAAVKVKESSLASFSHRLIVRRGKKNAIVAVAHKLLVVASTLIRQRQRSKDPGAG